MAVLMVQVDGVLPQEILPRLEAVHQHEADELIAFIRRAGLSERHARCVLRLPPERFREALEHIAAEALTVAQTESYVEGLLNPAVTPVPRTEKNRPRGLVRDARIFLNTINRAFTVMQESGLQASCEREEREDAVILRIRIPRQG